MPKRIPVDIQFLYESVVGEKILNEDPDMPFGRGSEADHIQAALKGGADMSAVDAILDGRLEFTDWNCFAFLYHVPTGLFIYGSDTHAAIFTVCGYIAKNDPSRLTGEWKTLAPNIREFFPTSINGNRVHVGTDLEHRTVAGEDLAVGFLGDQEKVGAFCARAYELGEYRTDWIAEAICGRIWVEEGVVSFWNKTEAVQQHLKKFVKAFHTAFGLDPATMAYEVMEVVFSLKQLAGKEDLDQAPKMSDEEYKEMLAKQHLDPKTKEKLAGDDYKSQHFKKLAQGHDFAAKANARKQTSDGVIRTGTLLNESPDEVYLKPDSETPDLTYTAKDAVPFIYDFKGDLMFSAKNLYKSDPTHWEIVVALKDIKLYLENNAYDEQDARKKFNDPAFWGPATRHDPSKKTLTSRLEIHYSGTPDAAFDYLWNKMEYMHSEPHPDDFRVNGVLGLLGRAWKEHHVLSLWNKTPVCIALKQKGFLDKIINHLGMKQQGLLFSPGDSIEVIPYEDLGSADVNVMPADQYKAMLAKQHLDPKAKKKLAGDDYRDQHLRKHAQGHDFAAKANARKQTSDGIVKLKDLLKEDPEDMDIVDADGDIEGAVSYLNAEARAFTYFPEEDIYIQATKNSIYHYSLIELMKSVANDRAYLENGKLFIDGFDCNVIVNADPNEFVEFCKKKVKERGFIGRIDDRSEIRLWGFLGRKWDRRNAVSFWCQGYWLEKMKERGILDAIIKHANLNPVNIAIGFGDSSSGNRGDFTDDSGKMSDEEYRQNLAKQHLDPEAKKKLSGDDYKMSHLKKHAQGHDFAAKANAKKQTSDSIIRLKDLIDPS